MNPAQERTAIVKVVIPGRALSQSILKEWTGQQGINLNILRGRVTLDQACYELEVRGSASTVARIVRQSAPWDASRRFLNPSPMGALA